MYGHDLHLASPFRCMYGYCSVLRVEGGAVRTVRYTIVAFPGSSVSCWSDCGSFLFLPVGLGCGDLRVGSK